MTCIRFTQFLLFLLTLRHVLSVESEPVFRAKGSNFEMGYCFGVDYIVVYRVAEEGDQLLGNSSDRNLPGAPPADLRDRIRISEDHNLLGLQITNLTQKDSGVYRRECWQNQTQTSQHTHLLSVCNQEVESEEILVKQEEGGGVELHCSTTLIGQEGISVRWYHEMYPNYRLTLFLDSSVSMKPLAGEQLGVVEVRDKGARLLLDDSVLKNNHHFYCLVVKGADCLSFQNMYPPEQTDVREIFASEGDRMVLECPVDGQDQLWETPLGNITGSGASDNWMHISSKDSQDFSLVIPSVSDKHGGEYSCVSSTLELLYSLVICSMKFSRNKPVHAGGTVSLRCIFDQTASHRVQWHRQLPSGEDELIHDSEEDTIATPEDLRGRVTPSADGWSLTISEVKPSDGGEYFCVVLKEPEFLVEYEGEATDEPDDTGDYWSDTMKCISKQVTVLLITTVRAPTVPPGITASTAPSDTPNMVGVAVGVALVGLLVLGAIIAVIVMKRKARQRRGRHDKAEMQSARDPGLTEQLTKGNDFA